MPKVVKVVTGGICPKKTRKAEQEICCIADLGDKQSVRFVHTHKKNLTKDDLINELSRGGPAEKLIIIGCSKAVTQKILRAVGKVPTLVIVNKLHELIPIKKAM